MKINIRTRLLAYFLFAALIPLLVLAFTTALLIQNGLHSLSFDTSTLSVAQLIRDFNILIIQTKASISTLIFKIAIVASLGSIALSLIFSRHITKPIMTIAQTAKEIEEGISPDQLDINTQDEIGYLAQSFNSMSIAIEKRKEAEAAKENLVGTLTHDLKVPLLASLRALEYLHKGSYGELSDKQKFITEQLIKNQDDLLFMVKTILDTHKYEAGKYVLSKQKNDMSKLILECLNEIDPLAREKNLVTGFIKDTESTEAVFDYQEIKRVILNLLSNAINHTANNGQIKVYAQIDENCIIVSVEDNGAGICEDRIGTIFDKYSTDPKNPKKIGTGLGLYLSKHIVEAHNGLIQVKSKKNEGSTFYFKIPINNMDINL